jgi:hypothetical protein
MKRIIVSLFIIVSLSITIVRGQKPVNDTPRILEKLYGRFVNNYTDSIRLRVNDSIVVIIDKYVKSDSVFRYKFKNLKYLGQTVSPDSLLKIITWNLVLTRGVSQYFCYFIKRGGPGKENKIYRLRTGYKEDPVKTDTTFFRSDWYGALYYDIRPFKIKDKKCWILLGIDYGNPNISRKIIDVLSFDKNDSIVFGRKWFQAADTVKFREVFEYASNAMMSLRFKSDSSIVFDHLVPFTPSQKNDRQYYAPDYSNDAYNFSNGLWRLIINVDARNKE